MGRVLQSPDKDTAVHYFGLQQVRCTADPPSHGLYWLPSRLQGFHIGLTLTAGWHAAGLAGGASAGARPLVAGFATARAPRLLPELGCIRPEQARRSQEFLLPHQEETHNGPTAVSVS